MALVDDAPTAAPGPAGPSTDDSRLWRSTWRVHFYAGIFALPVLVLFALTGLGILYTDVINDLQYGDLQKVEVGSGTVPLDDQRAAVEESYPDWTIESFTTPRDEASPTVFAVVDESGETYRNVFVDPHTGEVQGDLDPGAGIVGLSNRLHGFLNNESVTVPMPTLAAVFGDEPTFTDMPVGDLALEVFAGWGLVLAVTGLYLWWPRKKGTGRALFVPRLKKKGRARWRDLHAVPGVVLSVMLMFFVVTGLPWSAFWGANWAAVATEVTPNQESFYELEVPGSDVPEVGSLDRVGNRIPWATREDAIPTSGGGAASMPGMDMGDGDAPAGTGDTPAEVGTVPAPVPLELVATAASEEGMLPGSTFTLPFNDLENPDEPVYGSYVVTNPWPSDMANQGAIYVDQFSGKTIASSFADQWGALQWTTELGVQTHMGTQFGVVSRIVMTIGCLLVLWAAFSGLVMFFKRRRGGTGFPRRPFDAGLQRAMIVIAVVLAVIYPLWGLSVLAVVLLDTFVIRKVPPLRRAFGMKDPVPLPDRPPATSTDGPASG